MFCVGEIAIFSTRSCSNFAGATVAITELRVGTTANADGRYVFTIDQARVIGRVVAVTAPLLGKYAA